MRQLIGVTTLAALLGIAQAAGAQGLLPAPPAISTGTLYSGKPIEVSETVPESLLVADSSGTQRTLLSYKAPLDVFVVVVFSPECETDRALQTEFRRFYEAYRQWRVAFLAVTASGHQIGAIEQVLRGNGMPIPVVQDRTVLKALKIKTTPTVLIIDEAGTLRYRGPLHDAKPGEKPRIAYAKEAIEAVIGHVGGVSNAEPVSPNGCPLP
jgi:hypothetical protein